MKNKVNKNRKISSTKIEKSSATSPFLDATYYVVILSTLMSSYSQHLVTKPDVLF